MTTTETLDQAVRVANSRYPDLLKRDVQNALQSFRDLHPEPDHFTFADGQRRAVVALKGTIPVLHKGVTYNIPVCLYLLDTHPYHPPICYVKPTADMIIKPSQHLDGSGRIYLPYLSEWQYGKCDVLGLLQIMVLVFQDNCPVFSRSAAQQSTPYPSGGVGNTPYPAGGFNMPMPQSTGSYPYPATSYQSQPYPSGGGSYPYPSSAATQVTSSYQTQSSTGSGGSSGTIQPEHIRASLLSAVEERIRRRLYDSLGLEHAELQSIRKTREDLNAGEKTLKGMLQRLQSEETTLQTAVLTYRQKVEEIDGILSSAPKDEDLSIDETVETTAPLYRQLVDCFVKDSVIDDAIYYLGQSLKKGQISTEEFLKFVRKLSREQFLLRATMQKCRQKAGLNC